LHHKVLWENEMTSTTETDLSALRALAEEGRYSPLAGGRFLAFYGALVPLANLGFWALTLLPGLTQAMMTAAMIGFACIFGIAGSALTHSLKANPGSNTVLAKTEGLVWSLGGIAIGIYVGMTVLRALLGLQTPPIVMGAIATVAFLHFGVAYFATASLSRQKWLNIPAAGSFIAAVATGLIADSTLVLPLSGLLVFLLAFIPGVILMRAERRA
jgi:hypothetical protein